MSITVVTAVHGLLTRGDYDEAASPEDIEDLEDKIAALRKSISGCATESALKSRVDGIKREFEKIDKRISAFAEQMASTLTEGQWKKTFAGEIADSLQAIEKRYKEINAALDAKMVKLVEAGAIEERVVAIFLAQESKIREIIQQEGKKVKSDLDDKLRNADILDMIRKESQTITWEI